MGIAYRSDRTRKENNQRYKAGTIIQFTIGALVFLFSGVSYLYWEALDIWYLEVPTFAFFFGIFGIPIGALMMLLAWAGTQAKASDKATIAVLSVVASVLLIFPSFWLTSIAFFQP